MTIVKRVHTSAELERSRDILRDLSGALRIGGAFHFDSLPTFVVTDPATDETIATITDANTAVALEAVTVAYEAGREWAQTSARQRSDALRRSYDLMIKRAEDIALLITREMGKPLVEARGEVTYATDYLRWYAEEALRPGGDFRPSPAGDTSIMISRAPVGTCLLITPWNFPMAMAIRKIAPALAAGCSVILKPAALTPLTSLLFADIFQEAGVPDGLVNVVTTTNSAALSRAVMADPRVRKVSFTGSTPVGRQLMEQAAEHLMRASMELGGNAPFIVFDDADLERAVGAAMVAKLRNGGQSCTAANRYLVQHGIADAFTEAFVESMKNVVVANGLTPGATLGPLIDDSAVQKCARLVNDAVAKGARLLTGGSAIPGQGNFFEPTVLDNVPLDAEIVTTEIFGPIAAITRFSTQAEAIARANDTPFGLTAYVQTQDIDRALTVSDALETGMVGINQGVVSQVAAPFGGVKHSGLGREGSAEGLEEYQEIRYYALNRRSSK
jgi:succinate-semialdehyde dehydrogenase/glutarate-semialdehyde dehydrogenase